MASCARWTAIVLGLCACRSEPKSTGIRIGDVTLEHFTPGHTSEAWVIGVLGKPTTRSEVAGAPDVHVLRYSTVEEESQGLKGLLTGSTEKNTATVYFVIKDGIVLEMWADREQKEGLFGGKEKSGEKQKKDEGGGALVK